jgi:hypothetical protein
MPVAASQGSEVEVESDFFTRNTEERAEIIEGLLREGQLAAFAGPFGMGKSPMIADLTVHLVHGVEWCGRKVERRPVIVVDCETPGPDYKKAIRNIAARLSVATPPVPDPLDVYLERDLAHELATAALLTAVSTSGHGAKLKLIELALQRKPNAVVFIDPLEMYFRLDTTKKPDVLGLYRPLRTLLSNFPCAAMLTTFNLRKKDKKLAKADLLADPRDWLEEVCGSLDLLNRSDVRLGIDCRDDDVRVINGIVRGREMQPLLIRSATGTNDELAGFERVNPKDSNVLCALTTRQMGHYQKLPTEFKFEDIADKVVPRSSLSRLIRRAISVDAIRKGHNGIYTKVGVEWIET